MSSVKIMDLPCLQEDKRIHEAHADVFISFHHCLSSTFDSIAHENRSRGNCVESPMGCRLEK